MRATRPHRALLGCLCIAALAGGACEKKPTRINRDLGTLDESNVAAVMKGYRGKVVVVNFWAIWCEPCAKEMPDLVSLATAHRKQGLVLLTVNMTGEDSKAGARRFLDRHGVRPPRFQYGGKRLKSFAKALGVSWQGGLPATFVFDRKGALRYSHLGPVTRAMLDAKVKPLL